MISYDQPDIFLSDFEKWLGIQISFYRWTVRCKHMLLLCSFLEFMEWKKKHIWKQAQMPQTWSQFTYLGDTCILLKKFRFSTFAKHKRQTGPSSVFIVTAPVLPAVFSKQNVCCGQWHKRQSTVQMRMLGFLSVCSDNLILHHRKNK